MKGPTPKPTPTAIRTQTPSPTPTGPAPVPLVREAMFRGELAGWYVPSSPEIAAALPVAGSAHSGAVSFEIDAPALRVPTDAAVVDVAVEPGATYELTAWVRVQQTEAVPVPAALVAGDMVIAVPELNAEWRQIAGQVVIPPDVSTISVSLRANGPLSGVAFDDVVLQKQGGENLVPNPSFEEVAADATVANDTLVMNTDTATIVAAVPDGPTSWQLFDSQGNVTASGSVTGAGPVTPIPLDGAPQGYQNLVLTDATGSSVETPIALVDTETADIPLDKRFGVTAQFDRAHHAGGGRLAAALGYGEIHADLLWSRNQKSYDEYSWDEAYLEEFPQVRANGLTSVGVIAYGNKLYDGGKMTTSAEGLDAFGRYAAAAAQTFGLSAVEVFNEPNKDRFNKSDCGTAPTCYIPLLDSVRANLSAQGVSIPVIGGATALYDQEWFAGFWQAGGMDHLDVLSYHPYEGWIDRNPDLIRPTVAQSIADMQQFAGATKPIWITEMGFTTMDGGVSLEQQRDWLIRSEALALAGGVEKYMWYDIVDDAADPANGEGNFGLYEHEPRYGVAVVAPKPAAYAQALMIAQLNGRALGGDESDATSNVVRFGEGDDAVRVAWAVGEPSQFTFASKKAVEVVSSTGAKTVIEPVKGQVTVPLTDIPTFISVADEPAS